jgi:hypothetical protein
LIVKTHPRTAQRFASFYHSVMVFFIFSYSYFHSQCVLWHSISSSCHTFNSGHILALLITPLLPRSYPQCFIVFATLLSNIFFP